MSRFLFVLSILWLIFVIVHELVTGKVWFWVLPGMAPPIVFVALPAFFAISALGIRRFRGGVILSAVVAFAISIPSTGINIAAFWPKSAPPVHGIPIKIVQMNTDYWGQLRDGTLTDPRDKDAMLDYLRRLDADVYLLQEHMNRDGDFAPPVTDLSDVASKFPEYEAMTAGTLLTLSRLPVVDQEVVPSNNLPTLHLPPPPYALRVNVQLGDNVVSTYNVHMPIQIIIEKNWFSGDFYQEIRRRHFIRAEEFRALTTDVTNNPLPLVVAGDFNTSPAMGDNRGLLDVTEDAASFSDMLYPATWRVGGQLPKLWRNDWFLIRNGVRVTGFESRDPEGNSDHLVQVADLSIGPTQAVASR